MQVKSSITSLDIPTAPVEESKTANKPNEKLQGIWIAIATAFVVHLSPLQILNGIILYLIAGNSVARTTVSIVLAVTAMELLNYVPGLCLYWFLRRHSRARGTAFLWTYTVIIFALFFFFLTIGIIFMDLK